MEMAQTIQAMLAAGFRFVGGRWVPPRWAKSSKVVKEYQQRRK